MKILLHDYSGHPFQVQLSRELARRGHRVLHVFSASFQTPKANLRRLADDPPGLTIEAVTLSESFDKYSFVKRRRQEIETGRLVGEKIRSFRPDVVISSNAPLDAQRQIMRNARAVDARFVFWLQDLYSEALGSILPRKFPVLGHLVAAFYRWLEFDMLRKSDQVIAITGDFVAKLADNGVSRSRIAVIENWAPLDGVVTGERDNPWAKAHMSGPGLRIVYSGTLGYKHNPSLLIQMARELDGHVYVFSEGEVARKLAESARTEGVTNLSVSGWVPFEDLSKMLSAADIVVALLQPDAGGFSVPSKVLTYLCAGRPIVAVIPEGNLARKIILEAEAGAVSSPGEVNQLVAQARELAGDPALRRRMGANGRAYALKHFDIRTIGDSFERVLTVSS